MLHWILKDATKAFKMDNTIPFFTTPQACIVDARGNEVFKQETSLVDKWARGMFECISKSCPEGG